MVKVYLSVLLIFVAATEPDSIRFMAAFPQTLAVAAERHRAAAFVERRPWPARSNWSNETARRRRQLFQERLCVPARCRIVREAEAGRITLKADA